MVPDGAWLQAAIHTPAGPSPRSRHLSSIGKVGKDSIREVCPSGSIKEGFP